MPAMTRRTRLLAATLPLVVAATLIVGCESGTAPVASAPTESPAGSPDSAKAATANSASDAAPKAAAQAATAEAPSDESGATPANAALAATNSAAAQDITAGPLQIAYPQEGTLFPPESVAPTFLWRGGGAAATTWSITVQTEGDPDLHFSADQRRWRPSEDEWKAIKKRSLERDATVTLTKADDATGSAVIRFRTSSDPVGDSLFYREVPLPFLTAVQDPSRIRWRFGTVDMPDGPPIVLQNLPVCGNCHSFADDGSALGLDVDYGNDKGAYAIIDTDKQMVLNDAKIITWADFRKEDGELTFGLMSRVSPTGRYVISTVKDRSVFVATPDIWFSQLFFPIKGILVVYDRETKKFTELHGADDPKYVQTNAVWSPDGKEILFARAEAYKPTNLEQKNAALIDEKDVPEFTRDHKPFRYDLYRIPFNDGKGGKAEPVVGASGDGRSNFFPKYSPDGKWVIFCKANSYMLLQPDAELYIVPTAGGEARRLRYNTARMNSWHSWSSNSRWLVFSSKVNTAYTQLFLTHIDEDGNDSPPVLLERFTSSDRAANIPEFVKLPGDAIKEIREEFLDAYSFLRAGMANEHTGDHAGAERSFLRGIELNPNDVELHNSLGWTLYQDARGQEAVVEFEKALALDPKHVKAHNNMALALVELGRLEDAASHLRQSVALEPAAEIYSDLGFIVARLGKPDEATALYRKALEVDPTCASAHANLGLEAAKTGDYVEAAAHYRQAIESKPDAATYNSLGYVLVRQKKPEDAIAAFLKASELDPKYTPALENLGDAYARENKPAEAEAWYRRALEQKPTPMVHNNLGGVLRKLGRNDEAATEFSKALALDPKNPVAKVNLKQLQK